MSDHTTARDRELRQMLVATAVAAPSPSARPRTTIALVGAFVAAGALTGGAVSATALSLPAPSSTVSVEEMAHGLVSDDAQLFGTPFILAGQGDTHVLLGSRPAGATDFIVAFNCLDAGTYEVRVDQDHVMPVTCGDISAGSSGGGISFRIDTTAAVEHSLTIETGRSERFAVWASWSAPATLPEPSPAQRDALADGAVSEAEYRDGFARYQQCMADAGHPLHVVNDTDIVIRYVYSPEAARSGVERRCYTSEFGGLDAGWQGANSYTSQAFVALRKCLEAEGITPAGDVAGVEAQLKSNNIDPIECITGTTPPFEE